MAAAFPITSQPIIKYGSCVIFQPRSAQRRISKKVKTQPKLRAIVMAEEILTKGGFTPEEISQFKMEAQTCDDVEALVGKCSQSSAPR